MLSFTRESTHYLIIANIWFAAMILAQHSHDQIFCLVGGTFWLIAGWFVSRKERQI